MQILIGKALPAILVGLIQSTIIFLIIRFWFQIPMNGSVWLLYFGLLSFNIAVVGVGCRFPRCRTACSRPCSTPSW